MDWLAVVAYEQGASAAARGHWREALRLRRAAGDRAQSADSLEGFAGLAVIDGDPVRALRLAGAAAAVRRAIGLRVGTPERARLARWLAPARDALGPAAAAAVAEGEAMLLEQAVAYALAETPDADLA